MTLVCILLYICCLLFLFWVCSPLSSLFRFSPLSISVCDAVCSCLQLDCVWFHFLFSSLQEKERKRANSWRIGGKSSLWGKASNGDEKVFPNPPFFIIIIIIITLSSIHSFRSCCSLFILSFFWFPFVFLIDDRFFSLQIASTYYAKVTRWSIQSAPCSQSWAASPIWFAIAKTVSEITESWTWFFLFLSIQLYRNFMFLVLERIIRSKYFFDFVSCHSFSSNHVGGFDIHTVFAFLLCS